MTESDPVLVGVVSFVLVLTRCSGFVIASPIWGDSMMPNTVKIGLSLALSGVMCMHCSMPDLADADTMTRAMTIQVPVEFCLGSLLGLTMSMLFLPVRIAGSFLMQEVGLTLGNLTSPGMNEPPPGIEMMLYLAGVVCFFGLNLHHWLIAALSLSFQSIPSGELPWKAWMVWYVQELSTAHDLGFVVIGGMVVALMALSVFLLFLAKASPIFNLFTIGTSIRLAVGMVALLVFLPDIVWAAVASLRTTADRMLITLAP